MATKVPKGDPKPSWSDSRLIDACLRGRYRAWDALVDKYRRLVFSIALEYGVPYDDAGDLFQSVWLDAFNGLPELRKKKAFKSWLISVTLRRCYRWRESRQRQGALMEAEKLAPREEVEPGFVARLEREQLVREAIFELPERCQEMIRLLFFSLPPRPYQEVAERLGLARGSIGFIRGRCLARLRKILASKGL